MESRSIPIVLGGLALEPSPFQSYREKSTTRVRNPPTDRTRAYTIQSALAQPSEHAVIEIDRPPQIGNREINVTQRTSNHCSFRRAKHGTTFPRQGRSRHKAVRLHPAKPSSESPIRVDELTVASHYARSRKMARTLLRGTSPAAMLVSVAVLSDEHVQQLLRLLQPVDAVERGAPLPRGAHRSCSQSSRASAMPAAVGLVRAAAGGERPILNHKAALQPGMRKAAYEAGQLEMIDRPLGELLGGTLRSRE
jgi:hypothetical protein